MDRYPLMPLIHRRQK